jgi:hypothetical protein
MLQEVSEIVGTEFSPEIDTSGVSLAIILKW